MIRVLVFDLGGVIASDGGGYQLRETLAKNLQINSKILHEVWFANKESLLCGRMSEDELLTKFIDTAQLSLSLEELKQFIRDYNKPNEEMFALLRDLQLNYKLVALTNETKEWHEYRKRVFHLSDYFSLIIASCEVGLTKPSVAIYELLLEKLGVPAEEILFIDNTAENLEPAKKLGIKTIHFTSKEALLEAFTQLGVAF